MSSLTLHQVERLLDQLTPGEQAILLEKIARRMGLAVSQPFPPQDLYGLSPWTGGARSILCAADRIAG